MSRENVEIVLEGIAGNRSGDLEARMDRMIGLWHPDCEYTSAIAAVEPRTYRGHDGIRRYLNDLADRWAEWRSEAEDVSAPSPDTVLATIRFRAVGRDSGVPVEARLGSVFLFERNKILRGQTYPSRAEALEAAGLSE